MTPQSTQFNYYLIWLEDGNPRYKSFIWSSINLDINVYSFKNGVFSIMISLQKKTSGTHVEILMQNTFKPRKMTCFPHYLSEKWHVFHIIYLKNDMFSTLFIWKITFSPHYLSKNDMFSTLSIKKWHVFHIIYKKMTCFPNCLSEKWHFLLIIFLDKCL